VECKKSLAKQTQKSFKTISETGLDENCKTGFQITPTGNLFLPGNGFFSLKSYESVAYLSKVNRRNKWIN
jgi:hypothetical protein